MVASHDVAEADEAIKLRFDTVGVHLVVFCPVLMALTPRLLTRLAPPRRQRASVALHAPVRANPRRSQELLN